MGSRTSVSLRPAIQATGLLAPAPAGLTPAEHISVTLDARELLKLGIDVAERTVSRLIPKRRVPPSQTWRTFLTNHVQDLVSIDFFTVPAARLRMLFILVVLAHDRRRIVHFNVTEHPTAVWTAQQIVAAFPDDSAPSYLLHDRDPVFGEHFRRRMKGLRIEEVLTAPHSPWQNPFAERLIGSIRRECLNHVIAFSERHLRHVLTRYFSYYHRTRTHLSLTKDAPDGRPVEPLELGKVTRSSHNLLLSRRVFPFCGCQPRVWRHGDDPLIASRGLAVKSTMMGQRPTAGVWSSPDDPISVGWGFGEGQPRDE
jgi:putative transposase